MFPASIGSPRCTGGRWSVPCSFGAAETRNDTPMMQASVKASGPVSVPSLGAPRGVGRPSGKALLAQLSGPVFSGAAQILIFRTIYKEWHGVAHLLAVVGGW